MVSDTHSDLKLLFWNINGNLAFKCSDSSFCSVLKSADIVILVESKLRPVDHMDLSFLGFSLIIRNDRHNSSGGVMIAVKDHIAPHVRVEINDPGKEQLYVRVYEQFVLGGAYIPPNESKYFNKFDRFEYLEECIQTICGIPLPYLIVGDFNARVGRSVQKFADESSNEFSDIPIRSVDNTVNRSGRVFLDICNRNESVILTGKTWGEDFTCFQAKGASVVDTGIAPISFLERIHSGRILSNYLSDHLPIFAHIALSRSIEPTHRNVRRELVARNRLNKVLKSYENIMYINSCVLNNRSFQNLIERCYHSLTLNRDMSKSEISSLTQEMYSILNTEAQKMFPLSRRKSSYSNSASVTHVPHDAALRLAKRAFRKARRIFKRIRSSENYSALVHRRKIVLTQERRLRRHVERQQLEKLLNNSNSKTLWKQVKLSVPGAYNGPISAQEYTEFLSDIANGKFLYNERMSENAERRMNVLCLMDHISQDNLRKLWTEFPLQKVLSPKCSKAVGTDRWSGEFVRCFAPCLSYIIPPLFTLCLKAGVTPLQWDTDIKIPIPKPGKPPEKLNSLRPITLVNVIMKQYEGWLMDQLDRFCKTSEHQAGFKKDYSCTGRLFLLRGLLNLHLAAKSNGIFAVFIDFSSFFDTIRGELLCHKLCDRGVPDYLVRAIYGMLKDVKATVHLKGTCGEPFHCKVGLRQGSKSSPKLAALFLDEITFDLQKCKGGIYLFENHVNHIFYADDLVLLFENWEECQAALSSLKQMCESFGLSVSIEKSFSVFFAYKNRKGVRDFQYGSHPLPNQKSAKYLGCTIDNKVSFENHLAHVKSKANRAFAVLMNFQKRYPQLSFNAFLKLYFSLVYPVFAYSSEVFAWSDGPKYDDIFVDHLRRYLNLPQRTSKSAIHYFTGTYPIHYNMWKSAYNFWTSLMRMPEHRFEKQVLRSMKINAETSSASNWYRDMLLVFQQIEFEGDFLYWDAQTIKANRPVFIRQLDMFFQNQFVNWSTTSSFRFLVDKVKFPGRVHFLNCADFYDRRILSRIFLRTFKFESVCGAWHKLDQRLRICQFCADLLKVAQGDEVHYMVDCPRFSVNRMKCLSRLHIGIEDFIPTLANKSRGTTSTTFLQYKEIAKFIRLSFDQLPDPFLDKT